MPDKFFNEDLDFRLDDDSIGLDFLDDIDLEDETPAQFDLFSQEDEDEYFDVADKIMKLNDRLSEDIILTNIESQLTSPMIPFAKNINYVALYRKKLNGISKDSNIYNKDYLTVSCERVKELVLRLMTERYSVSIGNESEFYFPDQYVEDLELIYEFFFIRHFDNLVGYFIFMIRKMKKPISDRFLDPLQKQEGDIFVSILKKKFKDEDDVIAIHFLNEVVDFIIDSFDSAFDLFKDIINLDPYEFITVL